MPDPIAWMATLPIRQPSPMWRAAIKAVYSVPLDAEELALYREASGGLEPPDGGAVDALFVVGRRGVPEVRPDQLDPGSRRPMMRSSTVVIAAPLSVTTALPCCGRVAGELRSTGSASSRCTDRRCGWVVSSEASYGTPHGTTPPRPPATPGAQLGGQKCPKRTPCPTVALRGDHGGP